MGALVCSLGFVAWARAGTAGTSCTEMASPGNAAGTTTCTSTPLVDSLTPALLIPTAVCLVVWLLLRWYCATGSRVAHGSAIALVSLAGVVCLLAILSIGFLLAPMAILLAVATAVTQPPAVT
jgi:hypothetical protein